MNYRYESSYAKIASVLNKEKNEDDFRISGLTWRADKAEANSCYVAIKGNRHNGNDYICEAIKNGAELIISDDNIKCEKPIIRVESSVEALCLLAKENVKKSRIIGVTGSVGKTTVKEMIYSVLAQKYKVLATKDNENNEIGVAKTLLTLKDEDFCVVEMGMRARGEIDFLSRICSPEASVITNCGSAHIERLGSLDEIFNAKTEILKNTAKYCVLPSEKRFFETEKYEASAYYVGENGNYCVSDISYSDMIKFSVIENGKNLGRIILPSISKYNIINSLFAYAIGRIYSLEHNEIKNGLKAFKSIGLREQIIEIGGITCIIDCYNASYEGINAAITDFNSYCLRKNLIPVVILGCMREVGEYGKEYHYNVGRLVRDIGIKELICYKSDATVYLDGFGRGLYFNDKEKLSRYILSHYGKNYAILLKGSRSEKLEEIITEMKEQLK